MELIIAVLTILLSAGLSLTVSVYIAKRELRQRERVNFLLDAYRALAECADREASYDPRILERAISDIQLLGSPVQAELARAFAAHLAGHGDAPLDDLLTSLRGSLRSELGLGPAPPLRWLRISSTQHPGASGDK